MYVNKCIKCGREFETKNPKRVICPDCLYPDKKMMVNPSEDASQKEFENSEQKPAETMNSYSSESVPRYYSAGGNDERYDRPQRNNYNQGYSRDNQGYRNNYNRPQNNRGGYNNNRQQGGYNRGGYNNNRPQNNRGGYNNNRQQGGYNRGGYNNGRPQNNRFNNRRPAPNRNRAPKQLLISKEQLEQIELLYKLMLPLPNPDAHDVIGEKIGLEPRKVFFGINLVRQKMMLPKLPFPKRKLAISPDQLFAIKNLYEPLLPLPPIGCHKIIAAQLKMDEWRVHVGIKLIRAQMGLERWNPDRADAPEEYRNQAKSETVDTPLQEETPVKKTRAKKKTAEVEEVSSEQVQEPVEKLKRGRKKKTEETAE